MMPLSSANISFLLPLPGSHASDQGVNSSREVCRI
jgi:hypothetical protein